MGGGEDTDGGSNWPELRTESGDTERGAGDIHGADDLVLAGEEGRLARWPCARSRVVRGHSAVSAGEAKEGGVRLVSSEGGRHVEIERGGYLGGGEVEGGERRPLHAKGAHREL